MAFAILPLSLSPRASAIADALHELSEGRGSIGEVQSAAAGRAEEVFGEEDERELSDEAEERLSEITEEATMSYETAPPIWTVVDAPGTEVQTPALLSLSRWSATGDATSIDTAPPSSAATSSADISSIATASSATSLSRTTHTTLSTISAAFASNTAALETITLAAIPPRSTVTLSRGTASISAAPSALKTAIVGELSSSVVASIHIATVSALSGGESIWLQEGSTSSAVLDAVSSDLAASLSAVTASSAVSFSGASTSSASQTSEAALGSSGHESIRRTFSSLTSSDTSNSAALAAADASPSSAAAPDKDNTSGLSSAQIGGIAGGAAAAVLIALLLVLHFRRSRQSRYSSLRPPKSSFTPRSGPPSAGLYAPHFSSYRNVGGDEEASPSEMACAGRYIGTGGTARGDYAGLVSRPAHHDPFVDGEPEVLDDDSLYKYGGAAPAADGPEDGPEENRGEGESDRDLLRAARGYSAPACRTTLDARAVPVAAGHNASLPIVGVIPPSTVGPSSPSSAAASSGTHRSAPSASVRGDVELFDGGGNPFAREEDESSEGEQGELGFGGSKGTWRGRRKLGGEGSPFFGARMLST
ncbi:hypothetical protein JCM11251_007733 [Rhodosporidiobolus azoricus]